MKGEGPRITGWSLHSTTPGAGSWLATLNMALSSPWEGQMHPLRIASHTRWSKITVPAIPKARDKEAAPEMNVAFKSLGEDHPVNEASLLGAKSLCGLGSGESPSPFPVSHRPSSVRRRNVIIPSSTWELDRELISESGFHLTSPELQPTPLSDSSCSTTGCFFVTSSVFFFIL